MPEIPVESKIVGREQPAEEVARLLALLPEGEAIDLVATWLYAEPWRHETVMARARALRGQGEHIRGRPPLACPKNVEPLLGTMKDAEIGRRYNVSSPTARRWREDRGIPAYRKERVQRPMRSPPKRSSEWVETVRHRLGKEPDTAIAASVGVSRERVRQLRAELGIGAPERGHSDSYSERIKRPLPEHAREWFGVIPDIEIARRIGVGTSMISAWRRRYDLPAPPAPRPRGSRLDPYAHLVGTMSDSEVARQAGCSLSLVAQYRCTHPGLPRFEPERSSARLDALAHLFGKEADAEIARRAGCGPNTITAYRKLHPELPPPAWVKRAREALARLDEWRGLFGQIADSAIARRAKVSLPILHSYRAQHPELPPSPRARGPRSTSGQGAEP